MATNPASRAYGALVFFPLGTADRTRSHEIKQCLPSLVVFFLFWIRGSILHDCSELFDTFSF
jgi:hypothetical protein